MPQLIKFGRDIVISYKVDNRSGKPISLVRDLTAQTIVEDDNITFPRPPVLIGGHEEYNYGFVTVAQGRSYRGQLKVSKDEYKESQSWSVNVGFGYVTNITGLNPSPVQIKDPAPFKSLLHSRLITLLLSGLSVEVK